MKTIEELKKEFLTGSLLRDFLDNLEHLKQQQDHQSETMVEFNNRLQKMEALTAVLAKVRLADLEIQLPKINMLKDQILEVQRRLDKLEGFVADMTQKKKALDGVFGMLSEDEAERMKAFMREPGYGTSVSSPIASPEDRQLDIEVARALKHVCVFENVRQGGWGWYQDASTFRPPIKTIGYVWVDLPHYSTDDSEARKALREYCDSNQLCYEINRLYNEIGVLYSCRVWFLGQLGDTSPLCGTEVLAICRAIGAHNKATK
jgi:hypothetical protein